MKRWEATRSGESQCEGSVLGEDHDAIEAARQPMRLSWVEKSLFVAIGATFFALGGTAIYFEYAPAANTRFGPTDPLEGKSAVHYGLLLLLVAVLPLIALIPSYKARLYFGAACFVALMTALLLLL